ncbi:hypothetical protein GCM10008090_29610 [Arenicella chitinivorans]|uniref:HTH araC/xylS-type domain-containing protein n=2 Tax=Arenicella chitinivorans TaxID=1329800 RepID=A0A918RZY3_9GAMM|nr:hypothetical protein GCM10008090_29610 [Arenicella chitinivorans]
MRPFIRRALYVQVDDEIDTVIKPRPTGYPYLIWVVRGLLTQELGGNHRYGAGNLFVPGQIKDHEIGIRYTGKLIMLMLEFTAFGCYELFGVTGRETLNRSPTLASLCPTGAKFERKVQAQSVSIDVADITARFEVLFTNLEQVPSVRLSVPSYLVSALHEIEAQDGAIRVAELCDQIRISRRQFTRRFTEIVGVPPKYFCRVIQMNKVMEALMSDNVGLISDIANNAGYFDEAHLIHTVQKFFGLPATAVAESEHPAVLKVHASSRQV